MPQSLRHIKSRIKSIENTNKVTRAMEMISVFKLRQTRNLLGVSGVYVDKIEALLKRLLNRLGDVPHPLITQRHEIGKIALCVITSDTGLCSSYNVNILRAAEQFIGKYPKDKVIVIPIGRKGAKHFKKKGYDVERAFIGFNGRYSNDRRDQILNILMDLYLGKAADEVYWAYTRMATAARSHVVIEKFLNLEHEAGEKEEYLIEPDIDAILDDIIPVYLGNKIRTVLLSAFTAEHNARAIAMGEATHNAVELLQALIMQRNKIRQASITNEVIEIISSAEALRR